jgi:hypothetical protein
MQKAHRPSTRLRREVECFASYGIPEDNIARVIGINRSTLRKYYKDEVELGRDKANAQVAGFLFAAAKKGNVQAMIFWLKCRARWTAPIDETTLAIVASGKKAEAANAAKQLDVNSPFDSVIAARAKRNVGSELLGLARPSVEWPVADPKSTTQ